MKFLDIINESENDRLTKRINAIYKAFRTGKIKVHDNGDDKEPALYSYELSKDMSFIVTGMGSVFITPTTVKVKSLNKECNNISPEVTSGYIERALKRKFLDSFDIRIRLDNFFYTDDLEPYNEPEKLNEEVSNADIKKVKAVFKAYNKKVLFKNPSSIIYFVLPDDYKVLGRGIPEGYRYPGDNDFLFVQVGHKDESNNIMYYSKSDYSDTIDRVGDRDDLYQNYLYHLNEKMKPFNIMIIYRRKDGQWN